jgi:hypothetical protein
VVSVDSCLVQAEEVLQANESTTSHHPGSLPLAMIARSECFGLASFEDLLGRPCGRPGRWILIAEDNEHRHHFWQALAFEDGSLVTETVSNYYLEGVDRWTPEQGRSAVTTSPTVDEIAERASATLRKVFGLGDKDEVFIVRSKR